MDLPDYLKTQAQSINTGVNLHLSQFRTEVESINPNLIPLVDLLIASCQGGKRVRGMLVKLGYEIALSSWLDQDLKDSGVADAPQNDILKVAAAVEIFHAAILIHDDVIDESKLRRGQKTLYRKLGGDHYGVSQAIGLGDVGLFLPIKIITETHFDPDLKNKATNFFSQTIINTGLGEVLDVELPHLGLVSEEDVLTIHKLKTAFYTVSGPLILGATLAGSDADLIKKLEQFGENLGIAFQIQDDILGVFGDEEELGKSVTSDIEEGKNTLLITYALEKANPEQKQILERNYGTGEISEEGLAQVKQVFTQTGALDYSRQRAEEYVKIAIKILPEITKDKVMSNLLQQMAEYLVARTK
ncbi:MAG: polyprenyl synthetase family protein [Candidatus Daviesbacteria bacterium]|nr:polyprenyl synthetase family protein [Candidatus Daviesbacteria bacterium]